MKTKYFVIFVMLIFLTVFFSSAFAVSKTELRIGTSRMAGSYQLWGNAWVKVISDNVEGVSSRIEATGGPASNIKLIEEGINALGFASAVATHQGWNGIGWTEGIKYQEQRSLFAMYPSYLYVLTLKDNNIRKIDDLKGKRVDNDFPGTTPAIATGYIKH